MDKANITNLRTVTVYAGAGIPRVFRVENLPFLSLAETPDGGLCIFAVLDGIKSIKTRFAPGKWDSFDTEYLPREKPVPQPQEVRKVETPHPTVQNLETLPVRTETLTGKSEGPNEVTAPLPVLRVAHASAELAAESVRDGGVHPFWMEVRPVLSPAEISEFAERDRRRSEEAVLVLKAKFAREEMARGRAARFGDVGTRS